jgi:hypothetical protein
MPYKEFAFTRDEFERVAEKGKRAQACAEKVLKRMPDSWLQHLGVTTHFSSDNEVVASLQETFQVGVLLSPFDRIRSSLPNIRRRSGSYALQLQRQYYTRQVERMYRSPGGDSVISDFELLRGHGIYPPTRTHQIAPLISDNPERSCSYYWTPGQDIIRYHHNNIYGTDLADLHLTEIKTVTTSKAGLQRTIDEEIMKYTHRADAEPAQNVEMNMAATFFNTSITSTERRPLHVAEIHLERAASESDTTQCMRLVFIDPDNSFVFNPDEDDMLPDSHQEMLEWQETPDCSMDFVPSVDHVMLYDDEIRVETNNYHMHEQEPDRLATLLDLAHQTMSVLVDY